MLKFENVSKKYKNTIILENINFEINNGEVVSIIGKSGCGKSTLLKCINRLESIDNGVIYFDNMDISSLDLLKLRQKIGIVFQEYNLFEHLTVLQNLTIGLIKIKNISEDIAKKQAMAILKKIKLVDKAGNYPDELSGGQKQRVAIARTLLMRPKLILLDEPTSALDKEMKQEVINLIIEISKNDMTLLIVSHEEELVKKISDKIVYINNGKIKVKDNRKYKVIHK